MSKLQQLSEQLQQRFQDQIELTLSEQNEITIETTPDRLMAIAQILKQESPFLFDMLIDICGVDYLHYGLAEWATEETTATGFERGVTTTEEMVRILPWNKPRFAAVYHLLSTSLNQRLRLRVFVDEATFLIPSVINVWAAADWFEREAFDLYGILFDGHPDLRRILTDYGFIGHPFRKDFPVWGTTEVRYDAKQRRVIYEPVEIEGRVLMPKVIRTDNRYLDEQGESTHA